MKRRQIRERHLPGDMHDYQEDHLISLDLRGAPDDLQDLWPEPWRESARKDKLEIALNHAVCAAAMSLADAQRRIADPTEGRR
jgi:hypothetical protein